MKGLMPRSKGIQGRDLDISPIKYEVLSWIPCRYRNHQPFLDESSIHSTSISSVNSFKVVMALVPVHC